MFPQLPVTKEHGGNKNCPSLNPFKSPIPPFPADVDAITPIMNIFSHVVRASPNAIKASNPMFIMQNPLENIGDLNGFVKDIIPLRLVTTTGDMQGTGNRVSYSQLSGGGGNEDLKVLL